MALSFEPEIFLAHLRILRLSINDILLLRQFLEFFLRRGQIHLLGLQVRPVLGILRHVALVVLLFLAEVLSQLVEALFLLAHIGLRLICL